MRNFITQQVSFYRGTSSFAGKCLQWGYVVVVCLVRLQDEVSKLHAPLCLLDVQFLYIAVQAAVS